MSTAVTLISPKFAEQAKTSTSSSTLSTSTSSPPETAATRGRKREWNRGPLSDLFPRLPPATSERILDLLIDKGVTYNLSQSKRWNARRFTSIVVAHVRHQYSDYERLLRVEKVERYEARERTSERVWSKSWLHNSSKWSPAVSFARPHLRLLTTTCRKVLREWCPWDRSNEVLQRCFHATLIRPEERDGTWDPMDIDSDSDYEYEYEDDPMDLD